MANKKNAQKPWENVAFQLGKGKKTVVEGDPSKPPTSVVDEVADTDTVSVTVPETSEATVDEAEADQVEADQVKPKAKRYERKNPVKPTLDQVVDDAVVDDRGRDYDLLMAKRAEYKLSGFYHWQCPVDMTCWKHRGNRAVCPECGAERKALMAIYGSERVQPGHYEPYRGIQTWAQSANKQMAALASRLLREQTAEVGSVEAEAPVDGKPTRYYVEYEDPDKYLAEMERVGGDESLVDQRNVTVTVDAVNIAAARSKLAKIRADSTDAEVHIVERRDLQQNGGGKWKFHPFIIED